MKVSLSTNHLLATVYAACNGETRYYLHGVNVEFLPKRTIYTATDGQILICATHEADNITGDQCKLDPMIIDKASIKLLKLDKSGDTDHPVYDVLEGGRLAGRDHILKVIDGTFPDYRRVVPSTVNNELAHYNLNLLLPFAACCKKFEGYIEGVHNMPTISHNGMGPGLVNMSSPGYECQLFGVAMPTRPGELMTSRPTWLSENPATAAQAAE